MIRAITAIVFLILGIPALAQHSSSEYHEDYQRLALKIYRDTIAMRTAAGHDQLPVMAHYLADRFRDAEFPEEDIHVLPFVTSEGEEIASLVVRWRGDGSAGKPPVLFVAHMDVVDALPADWERDPFTLIEEDGYFFGRGTADDKFGTTILTATFIRMKNEGFVPTRDLIIAFSGDEETDMLTIEDLASTHRSLIDAEFALNADSGGGALDRDFGPIAYQVQAAEKTYADFTLIAKNPGGHSSRPRQDNAIYELAQALLNIGAYQFPVMHNDITIDYFNKRSAQESGELGEAMQAFARNPADPEAAAVLATYPDQVGITRTTCVATMVDAGHAENALPQTATANVNCRLFPGVSKEAVHQKLIELVDNADIEVLPPEKFRSAPASPLREDVMDAIATAVHSVYPDLPIIPYMTTGATDGRALRAVGIPTYGTTGGYGRAGDGFAHGLNERVRVSAFYGALEHWKIVIGELAGRN